MNVDPNNNNPHTPASTAAPHGKRKFRTPGSETDEPFPKRNNPEAPTHTYSPSKDYSGPIQEDFNPFWIPSNVNVSNGATTPPSVISGGQSIFSQQQPSEYESANSNASSPLSTPSKVNRNSAKTIADNTIPPNDKNATEPPTETPVDATEKPNGGLLSFEDMLKAITAKSASELANFDFASTFHPKVSFEYNPDGLPDAEELTPKPGDVILIKREGLDEHHTHLSGNPYDAVKDKDKAEMEKEGPDAILLSELAKAIILGGDNKCYFKVNHDGKCDAKRARQWAIYLIRAALVALGLSLDNAVAIFSTNKPTHDWFIVTLTTKGRNALLPYRAIFDKRARVLGFLRPFDHTPPRTQFFRLEGATGANETPDKVAANKAALMSQLTAAFKETTVEMLEDEKITRQGARTKTLTKFSFTFKDGQTPRIMHPDCFDETFYTSRTHKRKLTVHWPRNCRTCLTESHNDLNTCPWTTYSFEGALTSNTNPKSLAPGTKENRAPKRKAPEEDPEQYDMRPKHHDKKRKIDTTAETPHSGDVTMGQPQPGGTTDQRMEMMTDEEDV